MLKKTLTDTMAENDTGGLGSTLPRLRHNTGLNIVEKFWMQSLARELLPDERVAECLRVIAPFQSRVLIAQNTATKRAHYRNLVICCRVWQCPICASTITEARRKEIATALEISGLYPILVTYTIRHKTGDSLPMMLAAILEAFRALKSGKAWQEFSAENSWIGSIRSLEVTHGGNGWHPHVHELALLETPNTSASEDSMNRFLRQHWISALKRQGKDASWERGVDISTKRGRIVEYVAKYGHEPIATGWTETHELTKAPVKVGRKEGRTPMQLLADYGTGDKVAGKLYVEYSNAFKGRKQLVWSRGLKERMGIKNDKDDEQIMKDFEAEGEPMMSLSREEWTKVIRSNRRAELLQVANEGNIDSLYICLADILLTE